MTDRHAVIWTRAGGTPVKMGHVVATDRECRFSYTAEYLKTGGPAFSLVAPPTTLGTEPLVRPASERFPLHPRLMALLPPNVPGNLQRRIYAELLARQPAPPAPGFETEWAILMLAGRNGIGHLDVFASDLEAADWYGNPPLNRVVDGRSGIWRMVREEVGQVGALDADLARDLAEVIGPTPSVGGMTSKFLAAIPDETVWDGSFTTPKRHGQPLPGLVDVIIKVEQPSFEGVTALEALCHEVHAARGLPTPRRWLAEIEGLRLLAVERFDRTQEGTPVPYESLFTLFAGGSRQITNTSDVELIEIAPKITKLARLVPMDTRKVLAGIYERIVMALATGNGDLHLDNLGLLGGPGEVELAPVFDPAPMRAWPRHNLRLATPIDFEPGVPVYRQIAQAGRAFGLDEGASARLLRDVFRDTRGYPAQIEALAGVPPARKAFLLEVLGVEHRLAGELLG